MALTYETVDLAARDILANGGTVSVNSVHPITGGNRAVCATLVKQWKQDYASGKLPKTLEADQAPEQKVLAAIRAAFPDLDTQAPPAGDPVQDLTSLLFLAYESNERIKEEVEKAESKIARLEEHKVTWRDHSTLVVGLNQPEPHTEGTTLVTPPRATLTVYLDEEFGTPHSAEWKANCHLLNEVINIEATKALCKHLKEHATYKHDYALQLLVERVTKPHRA